MTKLSRVEPLPCHGKESLEKGRRRPGVQSVGSALTVAGVFPWSLPEETAAGHWEEGLSNCAVKHLKLRFPTKHNSISRTVIMWI